MRKFFRYHNVELLQYLGRAYFRAGKLKDAKKVLLEVSTCSVFILCRVYNILVLSHHRSLKFSTEYNQKKQLVFSYCCLNIVTIAFTNVHLRVLVCVTLKFSPIISPRDFVGMAPNLAQTV